MKAEGQPRRIIRRGIALGTATGAAAGAIFVAGCGGSGETRSPAEMPYKPPGATAYVYPSQTTSEASRTTTSELPRTTRTLPIPTTETARPPEPGVEIAINTLITNTANFLQYRSQHPQDYDLFQTDTNGIPTQVTIDTGTVPVGNNDKEYRLYIVGTTLSVNPDGSPNREITVGKYSADVPSDPHPLEARTLRTDENGNWVLEITIVADNSYVTIYKYTDPKPDQALLTKPDIDRMLRMEEEAKNAQFEEPFAYP